MAKRRIGKRSKRKKRVIKEHKILVSEENNINLIEYDPQSLEHLPTTYQELFDFFGKLGKVNLFPLREEAIRRIEKVTGVPLICYVAQTEHIQSSIPIIDDSDIQGFADLINGISGNSIDVFLVSNGGSAEAAERIVNLLREKYSEVRFILLGNAYSAATLITFSGDFIIMGSTATLGPIDPQVNGIPARAIIRGFESARERLAEEGPNSLTAYMPLLAKYDLHIFEICRSAQDLSVELALTWLKQYSGIDEKKCDEIVAYFSDYDERKSHARTISRGKARELGLNIKYTEEIKGLSDLARSLYNQYLLWFDKTPFYKAYENSRGINWGRQFQQIAVQMPVQPQS